MSNEPITTITYRGYTIEIHQDDGPCENPLIDDDGAPILVLHNRAEAKFGWTTDQEWAARLNGALEEIADRGFTQNLYGERGALAVIRRWLGAYHGIKHVLSVGAGDHSGYWAYLGAAAHWCDPGGWDSGWVGWFFATAEQLERWGRSDWTEQDLEESFSEFRAWVVGEIYGYVITAGGETIDSCWGFYGSDSWAEAGGDRPDGYLLAEAKLAVDSVIDHRLREAGDRFRRMVASK